MYWTAKSDVYNSIRKLPDENICPFTTEDAEVAVDATNPNLALGLDLFRETYKSKVQKIYQASINMQQVDATRECWNLHDNYQVVRFHCISVLENFPPKHPSTTSLPPGNPKQNHSLLTLI